jgi:Predicted hydrolases or acyltransferases (alpha/beta hydrolase superfamily)
MTVHLEPARVPVEGGEVEVAVRGSGEPVVLIHGGGVADEIASMAVEPTLRDHYQVISYHRRGYAGSSPLDGPASVESEAAACRAVLAALGVRRAHVVGKSYGGAVALQVAADAPQDVLSLVLLEPAVFAVPSAAQLQEAAGPIFATYAAGDGPAALDAFMGLVWGPDWPAIVERRVPGGVAQAERDVATLFESDLPALMSWRFGAADAGRYAGPVLHVGGTASGPLLGEIRALIREWLPQTEDVAVDGANHAFPMTHPTEVAVALADFFGRHPG